MDFLHEISSRIAAADSLHLVLDRIVGFITSVIPCDSCFIYVLGGREPGCCELRRILMPIWWTIFGVQIDREFTGLGGETRQPVAIASDASEDPRFKAFKNIPEIDLKLYCARRSCVPGGWWGNQSATPHVLSAHK